MADLARLDELRRLFAEHPRRYFAPLASALRRAGDPGAAVQVVRSQLAEQPEHLTGHVILAQALADAGDLAGAEAAFARAHAVDDGNVVALGALVQLARGRGDAGAEAHWMARLREADPEPESARSPAARESDDDLVGAAGTFELLDFNEVPAPDSTPDVVADAAPAVELPAALSPEPRASDPLYDPVVGLDDAPTDPLPAPMREALPSLAVEHGDDEPGETEHVRGAASDDTPALDTDAAAPPAAPFVTETMAGLLAAQGHTAQALDIYAQLLSQRPDDARLQARVDALRGASAQVEAPPAAPAAVPVPADRDALAADMWRAALVPVPPTVTPSDGLPAGAADADDLSFDRFFEAFGDESDPAPAEPAGDFERWAAEVDRAPDAVPASVFPDATAGERTSPEYTPDDPDADLAAFNAWLRGIEA
jgi:tetratricopeptide (TPR) repeat protein